MRFFLKIPVPKKFNKLIKYLMQNVTKLIRWLLISTILKPRSKVYLLLKLGGGLFVIFREILPNRDNSSRIPQNPNLSEQSRYLISVFLISYGTCCQSWWLAVIPTYIHRYYLMVRASSNFFFFFYGYLGYPEITLIWEIFIFNWFLARSPHFLPSLKVFKNLLRFMCYCVIYNRSCYLVKFCYWVPKLDFWVVLDP